MSNEATAQGFAIVEAVLAGTEVAELAQALETSDLDRSRAGARHLMNHPAISAVAADPRRFVNAARFPSGVRGRPRPELPTRSRPPPPWRKVVALRLHLDDSRPDNRPLRVLPGTHALGLLTESDIARLTTEVSAVDCTVSAASLPCAR